MIALMAQKIAIVMMIHVDDDDNGDDDVEDVIGTECLSTAIFKIRRCSRCTEAIRNEASIDLTSSGPIA